MSDFSSREPSSGPSSVGEVHLEELLDEFYCDPASHGQLGTFAKASDIPEPFNRLLNHNKHMTVTVEAFHGESVSVNVHRHHVRENWYSREITLVTDETKRIVQYGIVRLNISALAPPVWHQIESQDMPLGRVLIEHNVLREVQLCQLWCVQAGPCLAEKMHRVIGQTFYGRTALIYCDGEPAIELLEIVTGN